MRKSAKFWLRFSLQSLQMALFAAVLIAVFFLAQADLSDGMLPADLLPLTVCFAILFIMIINGSGIHMTYIPLMLGFGEQRKTVYRGLMAFLLAVPAVAVLLAALLWAVHPRSEGWLANLPVLFLLLLVGTLIGNGIGLLYARFRVIAILIIGIVSGCFGGTLSLFLADNNFYVISAVLDWHRLWIWLLAAAAVLLAVNLFFSWRRIRSMEVKL